MNQQLTPEQKKELTSYWCTRKGLNLSDNFSEVLQDARVCDTKEYVSDNSYDYVVLPRNMKNREVLDEYLEGEDQFMMFALTLNQIRRLINAQWNGENGPLVLNGDANYCCFLGKSGILYHIRIYRRADCWSILANRILFGAVGSWNPRRLFRNKPHWRV